MVFLWDRVFPDDPPRNAPDRMIENKLAVQPELLLVADDDGSLVGAVIAGFDGTRGWMYHLAVTPERRFQGIGASLMRRSLANGEAILRRRRAFEVATAHKPVDHALGRVLPV